MNTSVIDSKEVGCTGSWRRLSFWLHNSLAALASPRGRRLRSYRRLKVGRPNWRIRRIGSFDVGSLRQVAPVRVKNVDGTRFIG